MGGESSPKKRNGEWEGFKGGGLGELLQQWNPEFRERMKYIDGVGTNLEVEKLLRDAKSIAKLSPSLARHLAEQAKFLAGEDTTPPISWDIPEPPDPHF